MKIGVPAEIKPQECRVGLTPHNIYELVANGHEVLVQKGAGEGSGFSDAEYITEGASIIDSRDDIFGQADMIVKVKEVLPEEVELLSEDQIVFTYLHLAANEELTRALMEKKVTGISYDTVHDGKGLPLLYPMSVIAGRMAPVEGSHFLAKNTGGMGKLISGGPGLPRSHVVIIGGGVSGLAAAKIASGMGTVVTMLEINEQRISYLEDILPGNVEIIKSNAYNLRTIVPQADLLIGAVLIPGAKAPKLVTEEMMKSMQKGSVFVDIAIDQGGCAETSRATTHADPVYVEHDVVHYCVANMPGAYPRTSTMALTNSTLPYAVAIANAEKDWRKLLEDTPVITSGFNTFAGKLTCQAVADSHGIACDDITTLAWRDSGME